MQYLATECQSEHDQAAQAAQQEGEDLDVLPGRGAIVDLWSLFEGVPGLPATHTHAHARKHTRVHRHTHTR